MKCENGRCNFKVTFNKQYFFYILQKFICNSINGNNNNFLWMQKETVLFQFSSNSIQAFHIQLNIFYLNQLNFYPIYFLSKLFHTQKISYLFFFFRIFFLSFKDSDCNNQNFRIFIIRGKIYYLLQYLVLFRIYILS